MTNDECRAAIVATLANAAGDLITTNQAQELTAWVQTVSDPGYTALAAKERGDYWKREQEYQSDKRHEAEARVREIEARLAALADLPRYTMRGDENCVDYNAKQTDDGDWVSHDDLCEALSGSESTTAIEPADPSATCACGRKLVVGLLCPECPP